MAPYPSPSARPVYDCVRDTGCRLQAVLWDMDGLLVDSEPLWTVAEIELAADLGGTWGDDIKAAVVGTRLDAAVPRILRHFGVEPTAARVAESSAWLLDRMADLLSSAPPLMPGAAELLTALSAEGVPLALVSSSYRVLVDAVLTQLPSAFAVTVAGDEIVHGKPHPEPYETAAQALGVDPARCVVLEDSPAGVSSGTAAGCAVVAVPSLAGVHIPPGPRRLVARSLTQLTTARLRALVQ